MCVALTFMQFLRLINNYMFLRLRKNIKLEPAKGTKVERQTCIMSSNEEKKSMQKVDG